MKATRRSSKIDINVAELIKEVHQRPAMWNRACEEYGDRRLKARLWEEICENIVPDWRQLKIVKQSAISMQVRKKWRNVKDTFNKEWKRLKLGQDLKKKRYRYFNALSFMCNLEVLDNITEATYESEEESDNNSIDPGSASSSLKRTRSSNEDEEGCILLKREKLHINEDSNIEHNNETTDKTVDISVQNEPQGTFYENAQSIDTNTDTCFVEMRCDDWDSEITNQISKNEKTNIRKDDKVYDEDISFTEMMIPMLRRLNDDQKHFAQVEILNILHKAKHYSRVTERGKSGCNEGNG